MDIDSSFATSRHGLDLDHLPPEHFIVSLPPSTQRDHLPSEPSSSSSSPPSAPVPIDKGKAVARPTDIPPSGAEHQPDLFSMSYESDSVTHQLLAHGNSSSPSTPPNPSFSSGRVLYASSDETFYDGARPYSQCELSPEEGITFATDKGKGRDLPPTLPPLTFTPTEFSYDEMCSSPTLSSNEPGPSSFGSIYTAVTGHDPSPVESVAPNPAPDHEPSIPVLIRMPSRRRSLSNLSVHSTQSVAARSMSRVRLRLSSAKGPATLARKLFKRGDQTPSSSAGTSPTPSPALEGRFDFDVGAGEVGCFTPWRRRERDSPSPSPATSNCFNVDLDQILAQDMTVADAYYPVFRSARETALLKGKGRSYSSPFPLASALDVVPPSVTHDVFTPVLLPTPRNAFEELLPREIQLHILAFLVHVREEEHAKRERDGRWSVMKAASSRNKWVGREQGIRELVRLSRVCKAWMGLVFDGQIWIDLDVRPFPKMPASQMMHIAASAGSFVKTLDVAGHGGLLSSTLQALTDSFCLRHSVDGALGGIPFTPLTSVDLSGCSTLTTTALHYMLRRCPGLTNLRMKALGAVTNETCEVIYDSCRLLEVLDMSHCKLLSGAGIRSMTVFALKDEKPLGLKELKLSGLKGITDALMESLAKAAPYLQVLDLSYCKDLHNSSIEAFTDCPLDPEEMASAGFLDPDLKTVVLSAREAGRESSSGARFRRRVTRLRHLSLSSCGLLTEIACSHLAHALPELELLELGGIGTELKDDGLVRLLETVPLIRKIDLEDASSITDAVLEALTPSPSPEDPDRPSAAAEGQPGSKLEHLVLSYAIRLSNDAFVALIRNCRLLRVLEADGTKISGVVLKDFVMHVKERELKDAIVVAIDCRSVGENAVKELVAEDLVRPRKGLRNFETRKLGYLDGRDDECLGVGMDECDPSKVIVKTFYSWQTVDAVASARAKRRRSARTRVFSSRDTEGDADLDSVVGEELGGSGSGGAGTVRARWWSPGGRRSSGTNSPTLLDLHNERDGCTIM